MATRAKWERLYEVAQMKGDSETHPFLSPNDEFANFERWDNATLAVLVKHEDSMFEGEYARAALKNHMRLEQKFGTNPYKSGMIGSADAHTGLVGALKDPIGAGELLAVWADPDFDAMLSAFYYVRVAEIPTPRWTAYDAKYFGTEPLPGTKMVTVERAYTSPIWW